MIGNCRLGGAGKKPLGLGMGMGMFSLGPSGKCGLSLYVRWMRPVGCGASTSASKSIASSLLDELPSLLEGKLSASVSIAS